MNFSRNSSNDNARGSLAMNSQVPAQRDKFEIQKSRKGIKFLVTLILMGAIGAAGYSYYLFNHITNNPESVVNDEVQDITNKVGKLMNLPADEQPTLATVQDKDKLADQTFFKDAENGDVLLIYSQARQAIIYREGENRIINVGPITDTESTVE